MVGTAAVVLAAGKGTRMKSELPKVLCEICDRPLIHYVLDCLEQAGVDRIVVVVGYRADDVKTALAGRDHLDFVIQHEQLGTGHAVMMARELISGHTGPLVVVAGDSPMMQPKSIRSLLEASRSSGAACILGTLIHDHPEGLGRIVRDDSGKFIGIVEQKDASPEQLDICEVNMSTYVFDCQEMLKSLDSLTDDNRQREYYITDIPGIMLERGLDVRALPVLQPIEALSVNTIEQLEEVEAVMKKTA